MAGAQYEFSIDETSTLVDLAAWMKISTIGSMMLGTFDVLSGLYSLTNAVTLPNIMLVLAGVMWILVGVWLWSAAKAMKEVATTEGNDIQYFMAALKQMQRVYLAQGIFVGLNALIVLVTLFK